MSAVATIRPHIREIQAPTALRELQGWLIWRYESHPGEAKPRKVPHYAGGGKRYGVQGRPEDREQLVSFEAARAAAARKGFDGVGFAPMPEWNICALDFDHCVVGGKLLPEVEQLVAGTYAEYSPSGLGVRAFVRGALGNGKDLARDTFGFEVFSSKGFVTFTGNHLPVCEMLECEDTIADARPEVLAFCESRFKSKVRDDREILASTPIGLSMDQIKEALDALDPNMSYHEWLKVGMAVHHETQGSDFFLWDEWSSHGDNYPGTEQLEVHWNSFGHNQGANPITARSLVRLANENGAHIDLSPVSSSEFTTIAETDTTQRSRFAAIPVHEFATPVKSQYLIKGVIPRAELVMIFGASGSGKTFMVIDMIMAVARGTTWRDRKVAQGGVVYVAAEGANGVRKRFRAYAQHHGVDLSTTPVRVINGTPSMIKPADVREVIKEIGSAALIVIDTLAQVSTGASENTDEMQGILNHCKAMHKATGAVVLLIHHSGKDSSKGARGWSGLPAAMDAALEVIRVGNDRAMSSTKQKDDADEGEFGFHLETVVMGLDEDGDEVTSCIVHHTDAGKPTAKREVKGPVERTAMECLEDTGGLSGEKVPESALLDAMILKMPRSDGPRDLRKQGARQALKRMVAAGILQFSNGFYSFPDASSEQLV
jgi:hypothetical protein